MKNTFKLSILLLLVLLIFPSKNFLSQSLSGRVLSAQGHHPIPFVSISYNESSNSGTTSNIDGFFSIPLAFASDAQLRFSCLSYRDTTVQLGASPESVTVYLEKESFEIAEVIIVPKDNPAFAILRQVHQNRQFNNPENIARFKCKEYTQATLKFDVSDVDKNSSKDLKRLAKDQKDKDALFFEAIIQRRYDKTTSYSYEVEATRFPGANKTPLFLPSDMIQPFHFYDDYVLLGEKKYLNPIGDRNFSRYHFHLKDSLVIDGIQTYIIDYRPKSELRYEGLVGTLMISSDHWAIKSVTAIPSRPDNISVSILQNYAQVDGQWFPSELNFEWRFEGLPTMTPFSYLGRSYISEVEIGDDVLINKAMHNSIVVSDDAVERDSVYWGMNRTVALNQRQIKTYESIDTTMDIDRFPFIFEKVCELKVPVSILDFDITKLYTQNDFEGNRVGLGMSTNERLSERFSIGGFLLYGTMDEEFKYGANLDVNIAKKTSFKTYLSYNHSYIKDDYFKYKPQSGNVSFPNSIYNQDFLTEYRVGFKNTLRRINLNYYAASQSYLTYSEHPSMNALVEDMFTGGIQFDYDFYRKNMRSWVSPYKSINAASVTENRYIPNCRILFEKGFKFKAYDYDYEKLQLQLNSTFNLTKLGRVHYSLQAGKVWGDLAVSKLFRGGSVYAKGTILLFEDAFQTVAQNEFSNSEYVYLFLNYKFGAISFASKHFLPQVVLYQNLGFGKDDDSFIFQDTQPMDELLLESGVGVENVFRVSIMNLMYVGGGAAVFCRYGDHAFAGGVEQNLTYRAILTVSY